MDKILQPATIVAVTVTFKIYYSTPSIFPFCNLHVESTTVKDSEVDSWSVRLFSCRNQSYDDDDDDGGVVGVLD